MSVSVYFREDETDAHPVTSSGRDSNRTRATGFGTVERIPDISSTPRRVGDGRTAKAAAKRPYYLTDWIDRYNRYIHPILPRGVIGDCAATYSTEQPANSAGLRQELCGWEGAFDNGDSASSRTPLTLGIRIRLSIIIQICRPSIATPNAVSR